MCRGTELVLTESVDAMFAVTIDRTPTTETLVTSCMASFISRYGSITQICGNGITPEFEHIS